jgi:hypothetical protein
MRERQRRGATKNGENTESIIKKTKKWEQRRIMNTYFTGCCRNLN